MAIRRFGRRARAGGLSDTHRHPPVPRYDQVRPLSARGLFRELAAGTRRSGGRVLPARRTDADPDARSGAAVAPGAGRLPAARCVRYSLEEVAITLKRDPAAVRQLAVRARKHVQAARPRYPVEPEEGERIAEAFFTASQKGDIEVLQTLLAEKVTLQADGGGKVKSFPNPIVGRERIVRLYARLSRKLGGPYQTMIKPIQVDGLPGYASLEFGVLQTTAIAIEDGRITGIYITRNPDKLSRIAQVLEPEETPMLSEPGEQAGEGG